MPPASVAQEFDRRHALASRHADGRRRCAWCRADPIYLAYHDDEWGIPVHTDGRLFEMLCLEGAQAGLSWLTILRKRESYRDAFDHFDAEKMARYGEAQRKRLLLNTGIVRNRLKVDAFIGNARAYLDIREKLGSFDDYLWQFTGGKVQRRRPLLLERHTAVDAAQRRDEQGSETARFSIRRVDDLLCLHAGGRHGR